MGKSRAPDWEFILTFVQFSHQRAFNASLLTYQTAKLPGTIDGNMLPGQQREPNSSGLKKEPLKPDLHQS